jgi:hypothetical protein
MKLTSIEGGLSGERAKEEVQEELKALREAYGCGIDVAPQLCIYGTDAQGGRGVVHWIRPSDDAELAARRIAKLINTLGGYVTVEMTEWNPELEGEAIYQSGPNLDFIVGDR